MEPSHVAVNSNQRDNDEDDNSQNMKGAWISRWNSLALLSPIEHIPYLVHNPLPCVVVFNTQIMGTWNSKVMTLCVQTITRLTTFRDLWDWEWLQRQKQNKEMGNGEGPTLEHRTIITEKQKIMYSVIWWQWQRENKLMLCLMNVD